MLRSALKNVYFTCFTLAGILAGASVFCQIALSEEQLIGPTEALDCAHDYWTARLNYNLIGADASARLARADWYPSLIGNGSAQKEFLLNPTINQTAANLVLSEKIFDLSRKYHIDGKDLEKQSAKDDLEDQVFSILQSTVSSYFSAAIATAQTEIYNKRIERLQDFLDVVEELSRLHLSDKSNFYNLSAELNQTRSELLQLQSDLSNSYAAFLGNLGQGDRQDLKLQTEYTLADKLYFDAKKISDQLPVVQSLRVQEQALRMDSRAARASFLPTISVQGTYYPSKLNYASAATVYPDGLSTIGGYNPSSITVAGLLTWNIFDQGVRSIEAQQYDTQADTQESLARARYDQNEIYVSNLTRQYDLFLTSLKLTEQRHELASKAFESAMNLFQAGKMTYIQVKDSENSLFGAELDLRKISLQAALISSELSLYATYDHGRYRRLSAKASQCGRQTHQQ